ncbi:hypothetical protein [Streptomyces zingiberis]|uniref:IS1 family transposase n=1 Tax=Streptomyces zingiberis TaxID=2053010 RepID=A0ABX1BTK3_9ACTN|nr:hypothetical protein [Streptomyces zingiberis]NJQ01026.1 hypothetical protein [Streptomyces zingiberis]
MSGRAAPFHCPYCGDEDLRPSEEGHGAWECGSCARAFRLSFLGLLSRAASGRGGVGDTAGPGTPRDTGTRSATTTKGETRP